MRSFYSFIYVSAIILARFYFFSTWYHEYETKSIIEILDSASIVTIEKEISSFRSHEYEKEVGGKWVNVTDEMRCVRANFQDKVTGKNQTQYVYLNVESKFPVIVSEEFARSKCLNE